MSIVSGLDGYTGYPEYDISSFFATEPDDIGTIQT
jgi:hypothetical protein